MRKLTKNFLCSVCFALIYMDHLKMSLKAENILTLLHKLSKENFPSEEMDLFVSLPAFPSKYN